jgi:hypothetical protein
VGAWTRLQASMWDERVMVARTFRKVVQGPLAQSTPTELAGRCRTESVLSEAQIIRPLEGPWRGQTMQRGWRGKVWETVVR